METVKCGSMKVKRKKNRHEWEFIGIAGFLKSQLFFWHLNIHASHMKSLPHYSFCLRLSRHDRLFPKSYANSGPNVSHSKNIANAHMKMKMYTINIPSF